MNNLSLDKNNNEVKLLIDTKFYGYGAVLQAAKEYTNRCWVCVDGDKDRMLLVSLKPKSKDIAADAIGFEFYNYMLSLIQNAISSL